MPDRLEAYRAKRAAGRTPEPMGGAAETGGRLLCVQQHAARNLHWDLRLEMNGTLVSWAVPKGPSPNPADKRLAMKVEDHPIEYGDFEGVIPAGQYGAGPVILWDRGTWTEIPGAKHGLEHGKLLFDLHGYKLRGRWTLVKTKQSENSWLLIKERDALVDERGTDVYPADSVWSGLTVEEMRDPSVKAARIAGLLEDAGAKRRDVDPLKAGVMLATAREDAFDREGWVWELKLDGYRLLAAADRGEPVLVSRNGNDLTRTFPEVAKAVAALPCQGLVVDGEVVVHDARGIPSFDLLQKRGRLQRWSEVIRAAAELPATFYAFDLLAAEGCDARPLPLVERKRILREILPTVGPIRYSEHVAERGEAVFAHATEMGLEGVVGKKADSAYRSTRSTDWIKVRTVQTGDFVVAGWTDPSGGRNGFGALHVARPDADGDLIYAGSVGTGFDESTLESISGLLADAERPKKAGPPCAPPPEGELPKGRGHHWVDPALVVEVRYKEVTAQGLLRHPVFLRVRDDKTPAECGPEDVHPPAAEPVAPEPPPAPAPEVRFTNLDKVFWPEEGYTKGDLVEYYRAIAPYMLPWLKDRPLVLTRYPDGIDGKSFFQKDAPDWAPDWLRTKTIWSEGSERDLDYFVVDDETQLLWIANSGAILLHVWSSRVASQGMPDWCILDLDPKDAPFADVVRIARFIRTLCDEIGLPSFPKTSGGQGLHVLVPLARRLTHDETKALGELLARVVVRELPKIATIERSIPKRQGRVYVDYLQNGHGKLLVAPYTARPRLGATVSTPLRWSEVGPGLDPEKYTIRTVPRRARALKGGDPMAPLLEVEPDLVGALERLAERMG